ncbi:MAG: epoxyqueuosine reductase [Ruminococcaceae bacterium]|nr:epoxyqueuosine reductase [Oscillospiraceae bacterium]
MELLKLAGEIFAREKIEYVSVLPLSDCDIIREHLLIRAGVEKEHGSAIMIAVPYYVEDEGKRNISLYAVSRDYHLYFKELFARVLPLFRERFPGRIFTGFSDHSPINEVKVAARSGLGVIGKNHMLITEKYSSFVFLGSIICDIPTDGVAGEIRECENCGLCEKSCPVGLDSSSCLSALSQKKGELTAEEQERLLSGGSAWGCDICQMCCPHSARLSETEIDFFRTGRLEYVTTDTINSMTDDEFRARAFSWRGRETLMRNLRIFEDKK